MKLIFVNPRNNKVTKPKFIFAESEKEILCRYENYGTDYVICKNTGNHKVVTSRQFADVFDRIH